MKQLRLVSGGTVEIEIPDAGVGESFFLLSLHKAGSTLLNSLMRPISKSSGYSYFSLSNTLRSKDLQLKDIDFEKSDQIFDSYGYCYGGFRGVPRSMRLPSFSSGRTIVLVRDPRDMLTSLYFSQAYSHKQPTEHSGKLSAKLADVRQRVISMDLDKFVLDNAQRCSSNFGDLEYATAGLNVRLFRYEDIIYNKGMWVDEIARYLNIGLKKNLVHRILKSVDVFPETEERDAHVRNVIPGDHKRKLNVETISQLNNILRSVLDKYGY